VSNRHGRWLVKKTFLKNKGLNEGGIDRERSWMEEGGTEGVREINLIAVSFPV